MRGQEVASRPGDPAALPRLVALVVGAVLAGAACSGRSAVPEAGGDGLDGRVYRHELEEQVPELRRLVRVLTAECLDDAGYSQWMEAEALRPEGEAMAFSGMAFWHPWEAGPTTPGAAETFGLRGITLAFQQPLPGRVLSDDPAFDEALALCRSQLDEMAGVALADQVAEWVELRSQIRREFISVAQPAVEALLSEQISCFVDRTDLDASVGDLDDYGAVLSALGVESGEMMTMKEGDPPLPGELVVQQRLPDLYRPSASEVHVARHFVTCAEELQFVDRLLDAQAGPRERALVAHEGELDRTGQWVTSAFESLATYRESVELTE